ncbi:MAG: sulfurtransferase [Verrucomicrobiaceae bacterium]|nr:MAG: sulfurtransferase [Verrucomicrobiaceae bacterium]
MNAPTQLSGIISATELHHWLDSGKPLLLLDVMDETCFAEAHIPGAVRACVYETAFISQVRQLNSDTGASVVVYGTGAHSLASQVAAEKLRAAGYTHVYDLRGGLAEWRATGYAADGTESSGSTGAGGGAAVPLLDGTFTLDLEQSLIRWTGNNLLNHHEGTVRFSAGEITLEQGRLAGAGFTVDLRSLACTDLTDASLNAKLIQHLMDADFFQTAQWPEAVFTAESATPIPEATPGMPSHRIDGKFTLRGQTHDLSLTAAVGSLDGQTLGAQAEVHFDRTRWGALYGSGKFFDRLGQHLVNDLVRIHVKMVAVKAVS